MKFRFPIVIIDEDFRSENASGLGIRALASAIEKEGMEVLGATSYGDLSQFAQQQSRASAFILSIDDEEFTPGPELDPAVVNLRNFIREIRFKNADNSTVDLNNPMVKPTSGSDFSFEKWLRLNVTGGTYSQITNIKAYSDGANGLGTGVLLWAKAVTSYATPAEATATTGYTNFFTYTSGSPLSLGAGPYTSTGEKDRMTATSSIRFQSGMPLFKSSVTPETVFLC